MVWTAPQSSVPPSVASKDDKKYVDFLEKSRNVIILKLQNESRQIPFEDMDDVKRLFISIQALVTTNDEIWQRCVGHLANQDENLYFRIIPSTVTVNCQVAGPGCDHEKRMIFSTKTDIEINGFADFPQFPHILRDLFPGPLDSTSLRFIYKQYLEKAAWLQDDIAKPYLVILKAHIQEVAVSLGKIDSWLMESVHAVHFINTHFPGRLESDTLSLKSCGGACGEHHESDAMCMLCFKPLANHGKFFHNLTCGQSQLNHSVFLPKTYTLKVVIMAVKEDEASLTFRIDSDAEQDKLKRFLHFADYYCCYPTLDKARKRTRFAK